MIVPQRRQLDRRREDPGDVLDHGMRGQQRGAEIAVDHVAQIIEELDQQRLVEPELMIDLVIGRLGCTLADDGENGVERHHPADDEGDEEQPQHRRQDRGEAEDEALQPAGQSRPAPALPVLFGNGGHSLVIAQ